MAAVARRFNTTAKTVAKWAERFRMLGVDGLTLLKASFIGDPGRIVDAHMDELMSIWMSSPGLSRS
jgi:transposase